MSIPRQKFVVGAGLAVAATAVGACTSTGGTSATTSTAAPSPSASPGAPANVIAKTSAVPVGSGVIAGDVVVTQPSAGVFKGLSSTCTHAGCTVSEVAGGTINCPCHGSKFHLDGSVAEGPASSPLPAVAISVQGDSIVKG
ncbi:MAG: Rieske (2Fe-2S) protein [Mycobacteriaceae bacterium]|nr:Rieske (2Fe-2S) protein [Mycobacteriaceae bacterium]